MLRRNSPTLQYKGQLRRLIAQVYIKLAIDSFLLERIIMKSSVLIAQCNGSSLMTPLALRLVTYKPRFDSAIFVRNRARSLREVCFQMKNRVATRRLKTFFRQGELMQQLTRLSLKFSVHLTNNSLTFFFFIHRLNYHTMATRRAFRNPLLPAFIHQERLIACKSP